MRNPFARLAKRDAARPSLRERLNTTKAKAKQVLAVNRVLLKPEAKPEPAVDRIALVNYASWLYMERRMVCRELYPHMGAKADQFVLTINAAEAFHFPIGNFPSPSTVEEKASARAVKVLDMVGVDWRSDLTDNGRRRLDGPSHQDTGERPAVPYGWPKVDAELLTACGDLNRLDAAINAVLPDDGRDTMDVPGFEGLDEERGAILSTLVRKRSESLMGLQAKARAMMSPGVQGDQLVTAELAHSIANDLLGDRRVDLEPKPDPIFAAIEECQRLYAAWVDTNKLPEVPGTLDRPSEAEAASEAFFEYCQDVLLRTVPATARGCAALARYVAEFSFANDFQIDEDDHGIAHLRVLTLISRSPLL